jgi:phage terminase large subunit GpA-like protein
VPNGFATKYCGGPAALLTCAVDVHADNLAVAVFAWCRDRRAVLVDYWRFVGDTEQLDDPGTWGALRTLIETKEYAADDGKKYRIALTLVDSGYRTDHVHTFCGEYQSGVFPIKGREAPPKNSPIKEFTEYETPGGLLGYHVNVDLYKDRWAGALRRGWDGQSVQPAGHFNAPLDATDKQLKELTVEVKVELLDKETGQRVGFQWRRPGGAANELWDLLMYNSAALDLLAWDVCRNQLAADFVSYPDFFDLCEARHLYFVK